MRVHAWQVALCLLFSFSVYARPLETLIDSSRETVLEVASGRLKQSPALREGKRYTQIRLKGFEHKSEPGAPEIPYLTARVLIPPGMDFQYTVEELARPKRLSLRNEIAFAQKLPVHATDRFASREVKAYERTYGESTVEVEEIGYAASDKIAFLKIWPVRYDPMNAALIVRPKFRIHVAFVPDRSEGRAPISDTRNSLARYIVVNPKRAPKRQNNSRVDLLIAHKGYQLDLFRWIEFKLSRGRKVREYYVEGKSAQEIKQIIQTEYQSAEPPTETILVGNPALIPSFHGSGENYWTDYDYQLLGNDSIPDIALGRVPAANSEELRNFIDKAIAREVEPRDVRQILLTAGEDTSFGCPQNVTKVGENVKAQASDVVLTKRYRTDVGTSEVIAGYNANPNLIVYDGHGDREGMQEIPLTLSSLNKLINSAFPIIFDIACLNANWSSSANWVNFTTGVLFQSVHGAAGIMSSGGSGDGHKFFRDIGDIMGKARKNLANDTKMNEVAQVILAAKILNGQQDRAFWNYYGDPASSVWEASY